MKTNGKYSHLLTEANDFLTIARKEYASGKKKNEDKTIRQGAEKAWNASVQATKALAVSMGENMPRSYNAQLHALRRYEKNGNPILNGNPLLSRMFISFASRMHGECFYHGEYTITELDIDFEDVTRYIDIVKQITANDSKITGT